MATWGPAVDPVTGLPSALSVVGVQTTTDSAPSASTDGQPLASVGGFSLVAECAAGQSFTGTGTLLAYVYDQLNGWARAPELDVTIPPAAAGQRRVSFTGWTVANPRGAIAHIASGVGVTGGGLSVYYCCTTLRAHRT